MARFESLALTALTVGTLIALLSNVWMVTVVGAS